jgi:hypothetical protein
MRLVVVSALLGVSAAWAGGDPLRAVEQHDAVRRDPYAPWVTPAPELRDVHLAAEKRQVGANVIGYYPNSGFCKHHILPDHKKHATMLTTYSRGYSDLFPGSNIRHGAHLGGVLHAQRRLPLRHGMRWEGDSGHSRREGGLVCVSAPRQLEDRHANQDSGPSSTCDTVTLLNSRGVVATDVKSIIQCYALADVLDAPKTWYRQQFARKFRHAALTQVKEQRAVLTFGMTK